MFQIAQMDDSRLNKLEVNNFLLSTEISIARGLELSTKQKIT